MKTEKAMSERGLQRGACRCCLTTGALRTMERGHERRGHTLTYSDMLRDAFGLTLTRVRDAQLICGVCEIRLRDALAFRTQVLDSEQAFLYQTPSTTDVLKVEFTDSTVDTYVKIEKMEASEMNSDTDHFDDDTPLNTIPQAKPKLALDDACPLRADAAQCKDDKEMNHLNESLNCSSADGVHYKKTHKAKAMYHCLFCDQIFKWKSYLNAHTITCELRKTKKIPKSCSFCSGKFNGRVAAIAAHMWSEHGCKTECLLECDICNRAFPDIMSKVKHVRNTHHKCKPCSKVFRNMYERDEHVMTAHLVQCSLCQKKFATRTTLNDHVWDIHGNQCVKCKQRFFTKTAMRNHTLITHRERSWSCGACPKSFYRESALLNHQRKTHMLERTIPCPQCDYKAFNSTYLKKHMVSHSKEKNFQCQYCNKTFARATNLEFHERIHTGDKRQVCKLCGQAFVQRASLKYHLEKYHPGDV